MVYLLMINEYLYVILPMQLVNPLPIFSATWRKLALSVNYNKYKVSAMQISEISMHSYCSFHHLSVHHMYHC